MGQFCILPPFEKPISYIDKEDEVVVSHNTVCGLILSFNERVLYWGCNRLCMMLPRWRASIMSSSG